MPRSCNEEWCTRSKVSRRHRDLPAVNKLSSYPNSKRRNNNRVSSSMGDCNNLPLLLFTTRLLMQWCVDGNREDHVDRPFRSCNLGVTRLIRQCEHSSARSRPIWRPFDYPELSQHVRFAESVSDRQQYSYVDRDLWEMRRSNRSSSHCNDHNPAAVVNRRGARTFHHLLDSISGPPLRHKT